MVLPKSRGGVGKPVILRQVFQRRCRRPGGDAFLVYDVGSMISALAPFKSRSFRFQWPADLCTAWALEMETLVLGWYVLVETESVLLLTLFGSLQFIGTLVSPMLGVLGDRLGIRNVLTAMRASYALFSGIILALAVTGTIDAYLVLIVAALCGLIRPTDVGMRGALVSATVPQQHLVAAMAVSRTTMDSARVGGALAGAGFMAVFGMAPVYVLITLIHIAGVVLTMKVEGGGRDDGVQAASAARPVRASPWRDLWEGLAYVWNTPRMLAAMCLASLVNLTAFPFSNGLAPYIARDVFEVDQTGLGWLVASFAIGALIGSVLMSIFGARVRPARMMLGGALAWYVALVGFAVTRSFPMAITLLILAGIAQSLSMLSVMILLLRTCEPRFRGRIMGVRMLAIYTLPIGLMLAGATIPVIGYPWTAALLLLTGFACLFCIGWAWRRELLPLDAVGNTR
jgi:MFS family permease